MAKNVKVIIGKDGNMAMSFEGFEGDGCYVEADQIKFCLQELGINTEVSSIIPHDETEKPIELRTGGVTNANRHR